MFWEALDLPLRELEQLKTLKVPGVVDKALPTFY